MKVKSLPSSFLKVAREILSVGGATHTRYQEGCRHCFLGALAVAEYGNYRCYGESRYGDAYRYVIQACESLLPGWDHRQVTAGIYESEAGPGWYLKLPEAVLHRAYREGAIDEIALIVMNRAIKLAEADENAEVIQAAKLADEAELIAQGGHRETAVSYDDDTALV